MGTATGSTTRTFQGRNAGATATSRTTTAEATPAATNGTATTTQGRNAGAPSSRTTASGRTTAPRGRGTGLTPSSRIRTPGSRVASPSSLLLIAPLSSRLLSLGIFNALVEIALDFLVKPLEFVVTLLHHVGELAQRFSHLSAGNLPVALLSLDHRIETACFTDGFRQTLCKSLSRIQVVLGLTRTRSRILYQAFLDD